MLTQQHADMVKLSFSWQPRRQVVSDWLASPPLSIITDLASTPSLQPLLFLTFSDIYPPPQWQRPAHSNQPARLGVVVWISVSDVIEYKQDRERRRGQTVKRKKEQKQNTEYEAYLQ